MEDGNEGDEQALEPGQKVATEVCESDFQRFCDTMDIDVDPKGQDDDDKQSLQDCKRKMMQAMERGFLVINEDGEPVYTPVGGDKDFRSAITFHEPKGEAWTARDGVKEGHDTKKLYASMASMTGLNVARFNRMAARDLKVCVAVALLFLG